MIPFHEFNSVACHHLKPRLVTPNENTMNGLFESDALTLLASRLLSPFLLDFCMQSHEDRNLTPHGD